MGQGRKRFWAGARVLRVWRHLEVVGKTVLEAVLQRPESTLRAEGRSPERSGRDSGPQKPKEKE